MTERLTFSSADAARWKGLRLGGFVLAERLGVGGMSEVWRAMHEESGAAVAVKLIGSGGSSPGMQRAATEALRQEIVLLSRLDHPGILRIFEFGTVSAQESAQTAGSLLVGSPYLVTPWARGGSLDKAPPPDDFATVLGMLRALLLALAHAHARGVVHRDLKPANVLLVGDPVQGAMRPVLSDFGIAFALARAREAPEASPEGDQLGTPAYMAPEQILGPPLEQGPATDLYALGCVAYRLVAGHAPFTGATEDVLRSHVLVAAPPLRPRIEVPEGFPEWVAVLLAKQPYQRFPSAAFARNALEELALRKSWLPARTTSVPSPPRANVADAVTAPHAAGQHGAGQAPSPGPRSSLPPRPSIELSRARISHFPPTPPPSTWRVLDEPAETSGARPSMPDLELMGAGLGLFGLRRLPVAGREAERDKLYADLLDVHRTSRCRAVVIRGALGMGTTRLGEWLLEVASELDVGSPLKVEAGEARVVGDALVELLERLLQTRGLSSTAAAARAMAWARDAALSTTEAEDLTAILSRRHERFRYPSERHAAIRRALARAATRVPLVVLIDDAVVDPEIVALVQSALVADERLPVLFVLSTTEELIEPSALFREERAVALARVAAHPRAHEIVLGALSPDEHGALVGRLVGLEANLSREVVERTEGRPLFALQLVGDWITRGLLVPGLFGFTLREGAPVDVPDGIHALLRRRLDDARRAITAGGDERSGEEALIGLELAAILSPAPKTAEWHAVLDAAGVRAAHAVPELAVRGLVRPRRDRLVIAHRMLRESLVRRAREGGRFEAHHRVIAQVLSGLGADPSRLASHRLAAGEVEDALPELLASAELRCARSDLSGALEAVRKHQEMLDVLGAAPDDTRRVSGLLLRAEILGHVTLLEDAQHCLEGMMLPPGGLPPLLEARMSWLRGVFAQKRGQASEALARFEQTLGILWAEGRMEGAAHELLARALYGVGEAAKLMGDLPRAMEAYEAASAQVDRSHRLAPLVLAGLSDLENRRGHVARALELGHEALELFEARGARHDAAIARNALGDIERRRGSYAAAEAHYEAASTLLSELGSTDIAFVRLNLALIAIAERSMPRARAELDAAEQIFTAESRAGYAGCVAVMRLPCLAAEGDVAAMNAVLDAQAQLLGSMFDPDLSWCLDQARQIGGEALGPALIARLEAAAAAQRARLA